MTNKFNSQVYLKNEIKKKRKMVKNLHNEIEYLSSSIEKIENSKAYSVWRILKKIKSHLRIFSDFKGNGLGLVTLLKKQKRKVKESKYITKISKQIMTRDCQISIIIPTYYAESYLPSLLKSLNSQKYLKNPELIIIDSESEDQTKQIAEDYGAKVLNIEQKKFSHSLARNIAAKEAKYDYLLFMVQDALPINSTVFAEMASILSMDEKIAAVSTVQNTRPDADIFARWQIDNHNELLSLNYNSISKVDNFKQFNQEPFMLKRRVSLLDDVCALYRKNIFNQLGGFSEVRFGEDLEFAFRALKANFKLGLLCSNGVIHSHRRPAEYFLRRTYVSSLVDLDLTSSINKNQKINLGFHLLVGLIIAEYLDSDHFVYRDKYCLNIRNFVFEYLYVNKKTASKSEIGKIISDIIEQTGIPTPRIVGEEVINNYKELINILQSYLLTHPIVISDDKSKKEFLEKINAASVGNVLARYALSSKNKNIIKIKNVLAQLLDKNI